MFSKNGYLLSPNSSISHPSTSVVDLNCNEILLQQHLDMFPDHYLAATAPVVDASATFNQDFGGPTNGDPSTMANSCPRAAKKDRHSKIYTAQGPRDRRVRLNMGVARRFFDLQEILGFDKPSKTLDWLLTKSKTAIKDLVQKKGNNASKSASSLSECEVDSAEALENGEFLATDSKRKSVVMNADKQKGAAKEPKQALNLAKESRAKARARARERTREKMCIKQLNETRYTGYDLNPSIPIHEYMNNQLEFCKISGSSSNNSSSNTGNHGAMLHCHPTYEAANDRDLVRESVVIKRKVNKHPSSILGVQQNLIISSSNYGVPYPYNASENWPDVSSCEFASQSNICAILDQQRFMNSASNN